MYYLGEVDYDLEAASKDFDEDLKFGGKNV
jgi:hypothetical protein